MWPHTCSRLSQWRVSPPFSCLSLVNKRQSDVSPLSSFSKPEQPLCSENCVSLCYPRHRPPTTAFPCLARISSQPASFLLIWAPSNPLPTVGGCWNSHQFLPFSCLRSLVALPSFRETSKHLSMDWKAFAGCSPSYPTRLGDLLISSKCATSKLFNRLMHVSLHPQPLFHPSLLIPERRFSTQAKSDFTFPGSFSPSPSPLLSRPLCTHGQMPL